MRLARGAWGCAACVGTLALDTAAATALDSERPTLFLVTVADICLLLRQIRAQGQKCMLA